MVYRHITRTHDFLNHQKIFHVPTQQPPRTMLGLGGSCFRSFLKSSPPGLRKLLTQLALSWYFVVVKWNATWQKKQCQTMEWWSTNQFQSRSESRAWAFPGMVWHRQHQRSAYWPHGQRSSGQDRPKWAIFIWGLDCHTAVCWFMMVFSCFGNLTYLTSLITL